VYQTNQDNRSLRSALLLGAASVAVVGLSVPATAQEATETVVVTGSRIPQTGLYSSSPVTAIGQQEMKFEGTTNVENLINNLPEAFADFNGTSSNGATGTASVNLRGLGASRTLVLIDGKRMTPGDPGFPVADLNQIPAALVDHIEVLTGGASAVYGSDAIAGVVNFIMRKDFQGIELDGQYSVDQASNDQEPFAKWNVKTGFPAAPQNWWGGQTDDATILMGVSTDNGKGNITAYLGYRDTQPVLESKRDFSACSLTAHGILSFGEPANGGLLCAGSSNYNRWIALDDYYAGANYDFFETGSGAPGSGQFGQYTGAPNQKYNYGPLNYLQRPDVRYTGGYFAHYEINPMLDVYSSFMFTDDHTVAQIAPGGSFLGNYFNVNCDNPLMTSQERTALCSSNAITPLTGQPCTPVDATGNCNITPGFALVAVGRRDIEGGPRTSDLRHTSYRMNIGAKGDLGDGWSYDVYGQYGVSLFDVSTAGDFSKTRVANALDVVQGPNGPVCVNDVANGCSPLDIFNGFGSINNTPAGHKYVSLTTMETGFTEEQIVSGSLTGDLGRYGLQSPWAKDGVGIAVGSEWRAEYLELNPDYESQIGDAEGGGGKVLPVPKSGFQVTEGFGELRVPIIQGQPFFQDLSVNGGYRYSSYSTAGAVSSYKYGAEWQPIDDFRIRASYQRAVRAPNVLELFFPNNIVLFGGQDPCASTDPAQEARCRNAPGAAAVPNAGSGLLNCISSQCNQQTGGNVNLQPEKSDTRTIGIVLTPTFLDGFTATVDYFAIKVNGFIAGISPTLTLSECYGAAATSASQAFFCPFVHRDPGKHDIHSTNGYVIATDANTGFLSTKGFDFELNYTSDLDAWGMTGLGSLSSNFVGTLLNSLVTEPFPHLGSYDCVTLYGGPCGTPNPKWRHKWRVTWSSPWDFDFSVDWRHLSHVDFSENQTNPLLGSSDTWTGCPGGTLHGVGDCTDAHIGAFDYFDVAVNWTVREGVQIHAGVNNIFDKEPPVMDSNTLAVSTPPFGNGNTYPNVYDSLGRTIFVGATLKY
jgi:iron complex outermembrane recepter protein